MWKLMACLYTNAMRLRLDPDAQVNDDRGVPAALETLGWSAFFDAQYQSLGMPGLLCARVAVEYQDRYHLLGAGGALWAQLSGTLLREANAERLRRPAVGDWVGVQPAEGEGMATIVHLFERRTRFVRQAAGRKPGVQVVAANVDAVLVVTSFVQDFNSRRIERYVTSVHESGARPVLVLNKMDLCPELGLDPEPYIDEARAVAPGIPILAVSATEQRGLDAVRDQILASGARATVALVGSSGVGKSTLVNWLLGAEVQKTAPVRGPDGRGRHTTTHRELIPLPGGGILIDTPGMRELQLWSASDALRDAFPDLEDLAAQCRFRDCRHRREPGCAVTAALRRGELVRPRYDSYLALRAEIDALGQRPDAPEPRRR
jgi:ribosome biogenesis GTPase